MHGLASVPAALQTGDAIVARTTARARALNSTIRCGTCVVVYPALDMHLYQICFNIKPTHGKFSTTLLRGRGRYQQVNGRVTSPVPIPTMAGLAGRSPQATCVMSACSETPASQPQELLTKFKASEQHLARRLGAHAGATSTTQGAHWRPDPHASALLFAHRAQFLHRCPSCRQYNRALTGALAGALTGRMALGRQAQRS